MSGSEMPGMRVTSSAQRAAWQRGRLPEPELVAEGVWAIAAPIPEGGISHTLSYLLLDDGDRFHLIDPGWDSAANLAALQASLATIGLPLAGLATMVATHHHPDHLGIAERLRGLTGAPVLLSRTERAVLARQVDRGYRDPVYFAGVLEAWGVPDERRPELADSYSGPLDIVDSEPDRLLDDGESLELGRHRLSVLATPGHTSGHLCLVDHDRRLVYSGDHVLPEIYAGIGLGTLAGDEPLRDYLTSLGALAGLQEYEVLPGHEYSFHGLSARVARIAAHHLRRTRAVAALRAELGDAPVWEYARRLRWTGGWDGLTGFFLRSALQQTEMHLELVHSGRAAELFERYPELPVD